MIYHRYTLTCELCGGKGTRTLGRSMSAFMRDHRRKAHPKHCGGISYTPSNPHTINTDAADEIYEASRARRNGHTIRMEF